jgi:hypothetical protein
MIGKLFILQKDMRYVEIHTSFESYMKSTLESEQSVRPRSGIFVKQGDILLITNFVELNKKAIKEHCNNIIEIDTMMRKFLEKQNKIVNIFSNTGKTGWINSCLIEEI